MLNPAPAQRPRGAGLPALALVALALGTTGCDGLQYINHVAQAQFSINRETEPIADVLASGRLSAEDADKLRLIVRARDYAAGTMGLRAGTSYTTFYDTQGQPLAYNLSAARRDALIAKTWSFPIVGEVPYLAFFDEGYLRRVERRLQDEGFDTLTYELDAYSTLGVFEDPVRSPMLRRGTLDLVETVIHELLHNTVWRNGATVFNESLATFVGRQGAIEFLRQEYGADSGWPAVAVRFYADTDAVNTFLLRFYEDLAAYYGGPGTADEKVAGREAVFAGWRARFEADVLPLLNYPDSFRGYGRLPTNNAWVLANYRYNLDLHVFAQVYEATGQDWAAALGVYRAAAAAPGDPFEYLRNWLREREAARSATRAGDERGGIRNPGIEGLRD